MRYKITHRLIGYFSVVLLLFSVTIGLLFGTQFTYHTAEIYEEELKSQAASIADTLSLFLQKQPFPTVPEAVRALAPISGLSTTSPWQRPGWWMNTLSLSN